MSLVPPAEKIDIPDAPDISPVELVHQILANIRAQITELDREIYGHRDDGSKQLTELVQNIHEIMVRASVSETALAHFDNENDQNEMNTRLEGSSEILQKIRKLRESVKELETELSNREYGCTEIIAESLVDVQEQMAYFDPFIGLPQIVLIRRKLTGIEVELRRQLQWSFREIGQLITTDNDSETSHSQDLTSLSQAYLIVNALGPQFRKDLLEKFAQMQLMPYEKLFGNSAKYSNLTTLDRRFAWLKRLLRAAEDSLSSIFPTNWQLNRYLFAEFCRRTKNHLSDHLEATGRCNPDPHEYVPTMLKALKSVISFEEEMKASFQVASRGQEEAVDPVVGSVSIVEAFDRYLGPYVQLEREDLEALMDKLMRNEENGVVEEGEVGGRPSDPCISSRKMFEFIKKSLKRCTAYSNGMTYLSLSKEFRICLHNYSESLKFRCPTPVASKPGRPPVYMLNPEAELKLCQIINTAEYCAETIPPLESMMKKNIQPELAAEVDFSAQVDSFVDLIAYCMNILTQAVGNRVEPTLRSMRHTNWATVDSVGDESVYVKEMKSILSDEAVSLRQSLSRFYFTNYCMKLTTLLLDHLEKSIWNLKRIAKTGAGQLLLDLNGIKEYLLRMPNVRPQPGEEPVSVSGTYSTVVNNSIKKIEVILKLVCTEDEMLNEMFALLWPDGKQSDLDAIIALKSKASILDPVGDILKDKARDLQNSTVGRGAKEAVGDMKNAGRAAVGGIKSAFGDLMSGNLFVDDSGHGRDNSGLDNSGSGKKTGDIKTAFNGINAAFGFMKGPSSKDQPSGAQQQPTGSKRSSMKPF